MSEQSINVSDFGNASVNGSETWVNFSEEFSKKLNNGSLPVITVTSNNSSVTLSVTEKTSKGFKVVSSTAVSNLSIDWIAMAKVKTESSFDPAKSSVSNISPFLMDRLRVPESTKSMIINNFNTIPATNSANGMVNPGFLNPVQQNNHFSNH